MRKELIDFIVEENKYIALLKANPQFRLQGSKNNKNIVGIIQGKPENYKPYHHLEYKYFDTWKEAYEQLEKELISKFDDVTCDEHGKWSQLCKQCKTNLSIDEKLLDDNGSGVCGVEGCENEAFYYIDF